MSEFAAEFDDFLTEQVGVEHYIGASMNGPQFGPFIVVPAVGETKLMIEDVRRLVRDSLGNQVVSESTIYVPRESAGRLSLHSRVTMPDGRVSRVIRVASFSPYSGDEHEVVNVE